MTQALIFKIFTRQQWLQTEADGTFVGAPIDLADGYVHLSTAEQVAETAAKFFTGMDDLVLAAVDPTSYGDKLVYEVSRGGALFPHLYDRLTLASVRWVQPLPLGADGRHTFPNLRQ